MELTIAQVIEATNGRLAQGRADATISGVSTDSRTLAPGELFVAIRGERFDGHDFVPRLTEAGGAVVEKWPLEAPPGLPVVVVDSTVAAYGRLAAWWRRRMPALVVAITGSNGKTTTKEMLACLLGGLGPTVAALASHNNHIGVPETLLRIRPGDSFAVVEIGTNHFGEVPALASIVEPEVALITNIGPSHLEAFGSEEGVAKEKGRLLDFLKIGGIAVLHADDPWSRRLADRAVGRVVTFGLSADADWRATDIEEGEAEVRFTLEPGGCRIVLPVAGRFQVSNCLAAMAVAAEMAWRRRPPPSVSDRSERRSGGWKSGASARSPSSPIATTPTPPRWQRRSTTSRADRPPAGGSPWWATCWNWEGPPTTPTAASGGWWPRREWSCSAPSARRPCWQLRKPSGQECRSRKSTGRSRTPTRAGGCSSGWQKATRCS